MLGQRNHAESSLNASPIIQAHRDCSLLQTKGKFPPNFIFIYPLTDCLLVSAISWILAKLYQALIISQTLLISLHKWSHIVFLVTLLNSFEPQFPSRLKQTKDKNITQMRFVRRPVDSLQPKFVFCAFFVFLFFKQSTFLTFQGTDTWVRLGLALINPFVLSRGHFL